MSTKFRRTAPAKRIHVALLFASLTFWSAPAAARSRASHPTPAREMATVPAPRVSVRAAGRGAPFLNLSDGADLPSSPGSSDARQPAAARPLGLASGDFNEDGVPDLICGYATRTGGLIALSLANPDSVDPNSLDAVRRRANGTSSAAPFASAAREFELPAAPEHIGAGDFDGDGHLDLLTAADGDASLFLLAGDGAGGFRAPRAIHLPGAVTALAAATTGPGDWTSDLVVGVADRGTFSLLVYDGRLGALNAAPATIAFPSAVTCVTLGRVDLDTSLDIVAASGGDVFAISRRDLQAVTRLRLPDRVLSLAIGDFTGDRRPDIAALTADGSVRVVAQPSDDAGALAIDRWETRTAWRGECSPRSQLVASRTSTSVSHDLIVTGSPGGAVHILIDPRASVGTAAQAAPERTDATLDVEGGVVGVVPMRLNKDALSDLVILRGDGAPAAVLTQPNHVFTVTSPASGGEGSLLDAITQGNALAEGESFEVDFQLPSDNTDPIVLNGSLPALARTATIDASSQLDADGNPLVEIRGQDLSETAFQTDADSCRITGFAINTVLVAVNVNSSHNMIDGNYLGTDRSGRTGVQVNQAVRIAAGTDNLIGEFPASAAARARKRKQTLGMCQSSAGSANRGGQTAEGPTSSGNAFLGNLIGISDVGLNGEPPVALHCTFGVELNQTTVGNFIGGSAPGAGNTIANNTVGVDASTGTAGNLISGNALFCNDSGVLSDQPPPALNAATFANGVTRVTGSFTSPSNTQVRFELFSNGDACGKDEGEVFLGAAVATIVSGGTLNFTVSVPKAVATDRTITATVRFTGGNTSGFSNAIPGAGGFLNGPPSDLVATARGASEIDLAWTDNTAVDVFFTVERKPDGGDFVEIGRTATNVSTYVDTAGLSPDTLYFYRVRAHTLSDDQVTDYSPVASARTTPSGPPPVDSLFPVKVKKKKVKLGWTYSASGQDRFEVLQFNGSEFVVIGTFAPSARGTTIFGLLRRTTYRFAVRACAGTNCSDIREVMVTTR